MTDEFDSVLSPEFGPKFDFYAKKWTEIGLSVETTDEVLVAPLVATIYGNGGHPVPKIHYVDSLEAMDQYLADMGEKPLKDQNKGYGCQDADNFSQLDFFNSEFPTSFIEEMAPVLPLMEISKHIFWCVFFDELALICRKPIELHLNATGDMHALNKPAILFLDGSCGYYLNGVAVADWVACKPEEELTSADIFGLENVDQRRELILRITPARLATLLNATTVDSVIHTTKVLPHDLPIGLSVGEIEARYENLSLPYELLGCKVEGQEVRILKMKSPSIDLYHYECVPSTCNTVDAALAFRNGLGNYVAPASLT